VKKSRKQRFIDEAWVDYQFGQSSCDHTDKECFINALEILFWKVVNEILRDEDSSDFLWESCKHLLTEKNKGKNDD